MASQALTEYERKRLDNIGRNPRVERKSEKRARGISPDEDDLTDSKVLYHVEAYASGFWASSNQMIKVCSDYSDDNVGISGGANFKDATMMPHDNQTDRWLSSLSESRAIWGWDDSYIFIGSMKKAVDVFSQTKLKRVLALQSPHMPGIPCRLDAHPYEIGTFAGASSGTQVYMWTMNQDT